jgi:hypothetical protein
MFFSSSSYNVFQYEDEDKIFLIPGIDITKKNKKTKKEVTTAQTAAHMERLIVLLLTSPHTHP